jgi:hypothetical protein
MSIEGFYKIQECLSDRFATLYSKDISREDIFWVLFIALEDKERLEWGGDLWDLDLEYNQCLELLSNFDFSSLHSRVATEEGLIPEDLLMQLKVRIKSKGQLWVIHRYDADPFPSNPHAHSLEQNIKLDLSNGNCYRGRRFLYTIKEKDLIAIRELASAVYKGELPPFPGESLQPNILQP